MEDGDCHPPFPILQPLNPIFMLSNYEQPDFSDISADYRSFLEELIKIAGLNPFGGPMVRIVHGTRAVKFRRGEYRLAYPDGPPQQELNGLVARFPDGREEWIPPDSNNVLPKGALLVLPSFKTVHKGSDYWVLEEWVSPEEVADGWEAGRWEYENGVRIDKTGPLPMKGCYRYIGEITVNKEPIPLNAKALEMVRGTLNLIAQDKLSDPWREDSPELEEARFQREWDEAQEREEKSRKEFSDRLHHSLYLDRRRIHAAFREEFG